METCPRFGYISGSTLFASPPGLPWSIDMKRIPVLFTFASMLMMAGDGLSADKPDVWVPFAARKEIEPRFGGAQAHTEPEAVLNGGCARDRADRFARRLHDAP